MTRGVTDTPVQVTGHMLTITAIIQSHLGVSFVIHIFSSLFPGHPVVNDPLYNHPVFGPNKGKGGDIGKTDEELVNQLMEIHNSDNWLGEDDSENPSLADTSHHARPSHHTTSSDTSLHASPPDTTHHTNLADKSHHASPPDTTHHTGQPSDRSGQLCESPDSGVSLDDSPDKFTTKKTPDTQLSDTQSDPHCYECTLKYRDPSPAELVMFLHALKYQVGYLNHMCVSRVHCKCTSESPRDLTFSPCNITTPTL